MNMESLEPERGTRLRRNNNSLLEIKINPIKFNNLQIINGKTFYYEKISESQLKIAPEVPYMIINRSKEKIVVNYNKDISTHLVLYDPYKYENEKIENIDPEEFKNNHAVPNGYTDILAKWYSIKFSYKDYNLIYIKPEMGISIQRHEQRDEYWEILGGNPIILSGNEVHYFVKKGAQFRNKRGSFHSIINPNKNTLVILKESWSGNFEEEDIERVFNPNNYQ